MIRALFARLTGEPKRGQPLFDLAVAEARRPHWYLEGGVPDDVDGRFAMLATALALLIVRLERSGDQGKEATVGVTERFVEAMDVEIREMGVGDPGLGKQVRKLVGALAGRVERWRPTVDSDDWLPAVRESVYRGRPTDAVSLAHCEGQLRELWARLTQSEADDLVEGRLG